MSESVKSHVAQHVPKKNGIVVAIAAVSFVMATAAFATMELLNITMELLNMKERTENNGFA